MTSNIGIPIIHSTLFNNPPADVAHPAYVGVFVRLNSTHKHGCGSARYPCRLQSVKARFTEKEGEAQTAKNGNGHAGWNPSNGLETGRFGKHQWWCLLKQGNMDNQHKHIKGYRDLSESEIAAMNEGKELAEKVGAWMGKLQADSSLDQRAVALGKTNLQQGFMWAIRGIAQPTTF